MALIRNLRRLITLPGCPVCAAPHYHLEDHCAGRGCPWARCSLCGSYGPRDRLGWANMRGVAG